MTGKKLSAAAVSLRGVVLPRKSKRLQLVDAYADDGPEVVVTFERLRAWRYHIQSGLQCHCSRCEAERQRRSAE
jgi:hypothetical protein